MVELDRDRRRKSKTLAGRFDSEVGLLQGLGRDFGLLLRQLASPHLLSEVVGAFGDQEVRRDQPMVEQEFGALAIGLANDPFDGHACVDDEPFAGLQGRRSSRPSRTNTSEGACVRGGHRTDSPQPTL
jgi:hypothetical protein